MLLDCWIDLIIDTGGLRRVLTDSLAVHTCSLVAAMTRTTQDAAISRQPATLRPPKSTQRTAGSCTEVVTFKIIPARRYNK